MSGSRTFGFTLSDVLIRIIPGSVMVLFFSQTTDIFSITDITNQSTEVIIIIVVASYVLGQIINFSRQKIIPVPAKLRRHTFAHTSNPNHLDPVDRIRQNMFSQGGLKAKLGKNFEDYELSGTLYDGTSKSTFLPEISNRYNLNLEELSRDCIYETIDKCLQDDKSSITRKYEIFYKMLVNMSLVGVLIAYSVSFSSVQENSILDFSPLATLIIVILFISLIIIPIYLITFNFLGIDDRYAESVINDFYIKYEGGK